MLNLCNNISLFRITLAGLMIVILTPYFGLRLQVQNLKRSERKACIPAEMQLNDVIEI